MPTTLLSDTFTDANGTLLASHTMDVGSGWTANTGTFKVQSNKATPNSNANGDTATCDAGQANYILTCDVTPQNNTNFNEDTPGLFIRFQDTSNWYVIQMQSTATGLCDIYENKAGAVTLKATSAAAFASGTSYAIKVVVSGTTIAVYVNGTFQVAYTSAADFTTATKVGLRVGVGGTPSGLCTFDNFLVQLPDLTAAGTSTVSMVGASTAAGVLSAAGTSTVAMVGAAVTAGVLSAAGTSTDAMVGASTAAGVMSADGTSTVGFVGTAVTGDGEVFVSAGTSSVTMVGGSTAAADIAAAGTSTVAMAGVGLVTVAGELGGAGTCSVAWGGQLLRRSSFYRPGRTDEGQGYRGRADSSDDGRRGRADESQEYRGRADEVTS